MTHEGYSLSTNYVRLWQLIKERNLRVAAWIKYCTLSDGTILWDLVEVKFNETRYLIGTRGIGYEGAQNFKGFIEVCQMYELHFIDIFG